METQDEFSDRDPDINASSAGSNNVMPLPLVTHGENSSNVMDQQSTPEDSQLSHQEEDPSDSDVQDEESGEEFIQQPHQMVQSPLDAAMSQVGQPQSTTIAHLNNLMANPHFLSKLSKIESPELLKPGGLEALQAALNSGNFTMPLALTSQFLKHHQQNNHVQTTSFGSAPASQMVVSPVHHSDSSQGNSMNGGEVRDASGNLHTLRPECSNVTPNNVAGPSRQPTSGQPNQQQQQQNWTYEEQFKQLYEISDDPKRKEFLDDLFSFMQKRGQPINRLPIMAKSVLDLYELYNLVVARGGLVDVINKKLWQEIIKGLHLPSSITSAAFTLRTQYQKHLYEYECHKQRLSTPVELKQAIDGNRREGRRSSYSGENVMQRNQVQHHTQNSLALHPQIQLPLAVSPATHKTQWLNGNTSHTSIPPHPHHPQHPQAILGQHNQGPLPGMAPSSELMEYAIKHFNNQLNNVCAPSPLMHRQGDGSPRSSTPPRDNTTIGNAVEMLRLTSWYNNALYPNITHQQPLSPQRSHSPLQTANSPEPQREALDLGVRSPASSSPAIQSPQPPSGGSIPAKRDRQSARIPATSIKRRFSSDDESQAPPRKSAALIVQGQRISISTQEGDGANGNSVAVSIDINGITYEGVLFAQNVSNATSPSSTTANSNTKTSRST